MRLMLSLICLFALHAPVTAAEAGKLLIWINADKAYGGLQQIADRFSKDTGIPAKVEHPDDLGSAFETASKNGKGPDIMFWAHDRIGDWIAKGLISPVSPKPALQQEQVKVGWDAFTLGGKVWGYPVGAEAVMLIYNRKLVSKPPASFEEIEALHQGLQAQGVRAIGWDYTNAYFTWPLLAANGGYVFARNKAGDYDPADIGVNNAGALKGVQLLNRFITSGVLPKGGLPYGDAEKAMKEGKQAMWINGPWAWSALREAGIDFGVAPLPTVDGKPARPFVGVLGAMLVAGSPNQATAVKFLEEYVLKEAGLKTMNADKPIGVPLNKRLFWALMRDPNIRISMDGVTFGRPMPSNLEMSKFWGALPQALIQIAEQKGKPEDAMAAAAKAMRASTP